jgi:hypothetical protein
VDGLRDPHTDVVADHEPCQSAAPAWHHTTRRSGPFVDVVCVASGRGPTVGWAHERRPNPPRVFSSRLLDVTTPVKLFVTRPFSRHSTAEIFNVTPVPHSAVLDALWRGGYNCVVRRGAAQ